MEKSFRLFAAVILALGIMSALGIAWNLYQFNEHMEDLLAGASGAITVISAYLIILTFHIGSFALILRHTFLIGTMRVLKIMLSLTGIISFFSIAVQKVMTDEIAREGIASGEFTILNISLIVNMIFIIVMLAFIVRVLHENVGKTVTRAETEDIFFVTGHALGIVSGFLGILVTISLLVRQVPADMFWIYLPFYTMILLPYLLAVAGWALIRYGNHVTDWYDEKQWRDMLRSSLAAIILTVPGLALLFAAGTSTGYYWFPYHISLTLLLFSAGTLIFYKRG